MRHYCTYFDSHYLLRGLVLYRSLLEHGGDFQLYVLCLDDTCYDALGRLGLDRLQLIRLPDLEAYDGELAVARARRSQVEYYFTLT